MKRGSKFVGHSTEIIRQSKIKGPLPETLRNSTTVSMLIYIGGTIIQVTDDAVSNYQTKVTVD